MKNLRYILGLTVPMLAFALLTGCGDSGVDTTDPENPGEEEKPGEKEPDDEVDNSLNEISLYEAFLEQFDGGRSMTDLRIRTSGQWEVDFDDDRTLIFQDTDADVFECTILEWPALTIDSNNVWCIEGESTGISYDISSASASIVAVIYDTEGIYVRVSTGKILFFHRGKVLDIGCFRFEKALNSALTSDVVCSIGDTSVSGVLGAKVSASGLVATVGYRGSQLTYSGERVFSSVTPLNYSDNMTFSLVSAASNKDIKVAITNAVIPRIPVLYIDTNGASIPAPYTNNKQNEYIPATMAIHDPDLAYASAVSETVTIGIRGRGNSTWERPKKPYKIKLDTKKEMLGMYENKHWVLIANYSDKSLFRNILAGEISRLLDFPWVAEWRPVEVYLKDSGSGEFVCQGIYMLTEHVRVDKGRIELDEVSPSATGGEAITGGYFIEADNRPIERARSLYGNNGYSAGMWTTKGLPVVISAPESPTTAQRTYIEDYIQKAENLVYAAGKDYSAISGVIDIDSFIKYFIVHEIAKDQDGGLSLSTYMWKPYMGKLGFPCVWDFDIALGNHGTGNPTRNYEGWHIRDQRWFTELFRIPEFAARVKVIWNEVSPELLSLVPLIREYAENLGDEAMARNEARCDALCIAGDQWNTIKGPYYTTEVWPNNVPMGSYQAELDYMLEWYANRVYWLQNQITAGNHKK